MGRPRTPSKAQLKKTEELINRIKAMKQFYTNISDEHIVINGKDMVNLLDLLEQLTASIGGFSPSSKDS